MKREPIISTPIDAGADYLKVAPRTIEPRSSLYFMAELFQEMIRIKMQAEVNIAINDQGGSIEVVFAPTTQEIRQGMQAFLTMLSRMEIAEHMEITPGLMTMTAPDKLALYDFLNDLVRDSDDLMTPDTYNLKSLRGKKRQDYLDDLYRKYGELTQDSPAYAQAFSRLQPRPYNDTYDFAANLYLGSITNLSVCLGHIYRCIQQEEGIKPDDHDNALVFGGYH